MILRLKNQKTGSNSRVERVPGIEPGPKDWKSLVLPLNYTRIFLNNLFNGQACLPLNYTRVRLVLYQICFKTGTEITNKIVDVNALSMQ